jgi:molecular chaperone GrpE
MTGKQTTTDHPQEAEPGTVKASGETGAEGTVTPSGKSESAAASGQPSSEEPTGEQLASELEDLKDRHLRLAADFENFKKRSRQERADLLRYASAQLAEQLLSVLDDFDRVLEHAPDDVDASWLKGVRMTAERLREVLGSVGVEAIDAVGAHFDPNLHEAIATEETSEHPEDTVVAELRRGYRIHDRVLRPAMVRIARNPAQEG